MSILRTAHLIRHRDFLIPALVFGCAAALYIRTAAPTLGGGVDSEEFQQVAYTLGIAHSTGYPLYLILGKIFITLFPFGNVAYRMNILSAFLGAGAALFVYLDMRRLTRRTLASLATTALFATDSLVWRQAGIASVTPLQLLLFAALIYVLLAWYERRATIALVAFVFGLGLAHHRATLLLAPSVALFVLLVDFDIVRRPRDWSRALAALGLPLLFYLYIPIRGAATLGFDNTVQGFIHLVSGSEALNYGHSIEVGIAAAVGLLEYLHNSFGVAGILFILIAVATIFAHSKQLPPPLQDARVPLFLGSAIPVFVAFAVSYESDPDRLYTLAFFFLVFWFGIGVAQVEVFLETRVQAIKVRRFAMGAIGCVLVLLIGFPFAGNLRAADWSTFDRVYKQWDEIFTLPIPPNATIVGNWEQLNALHYMQRVENRRADLQGVGTLYDVAPQTQAAQDAFADGRAIFLAPGVALPNGGYRYAQLGPLLQVRDQPQMQPPKTIKSIALNPWLTLADFGVATALEPYTPVRSIAPNRTARVSLTWRVESTPQEFIVRVRLYDPEARLIAQKDEAPVRGLYSPSQWTRGEYVADVHNFLIPAGSPPGTYQLKLQTLDGNTKQPTSDEITLTTLAVERVTNLNRDQVFIQHPFDYRAVPSEPVELWGYGGLDETYHAGQTVHLNMIWHAQRDIHNFRNLLTLELYRDSGPTVYDAAPSIDWKKTTSWSVLYIPYYLTEQWKQGEVLRGYYDLELPAGLPAGNYMLVFVQPDPLYMPELARIQIVP